MATVANLRSREFLIPWLPAGLRQINRCFLYATDWSSSYQSMEGASHDAWHKARGKAAPGQEILSVVEAFVAGEPWERFTPPDAEGMDPTFERRRPPNEAVVAIRTSQTRTLGFFMPNGTFVALLCGLADHWHSDGDKVYDEMIARAAKMVSVFEAADVDGTTAVRALIEQVSKS